MKRVHDVRRPRIGVYVRFLRLGAQGDGLEVHGRVVAYEGERAIVETDDGGSTFFCYADGHRLKWMANKPWKRAVEREAAPAALIERVHADARLAAVHRKMKLAVWGAAAGLAASLGLVLLIVVKGIF